MSPHQQQEVLAMHRFQHSDDESKVTAGNHGEDIDIDDEEYQHTRRSVVLQFESMTMDFLSTLPNETKEHCINKFHESFSQNHSPQHTSSRPSLRSKSVTFDNIDLVGMNYNDDDSDDEYECNKNKNVDDDADLDNDDSNNENRRRSKTYSSLGETCEGRKSFATLATVDETVSTSSLVRHQSSGMEDDELSLSSEQGDIFTMLTNPKSNSNKKTKKNQRSLRFMDDDKIKQINEIESFKETEYSPELFYSKAELEEIKAENETIAFLMENPTLLKYRKSSGSDDVIVTRGLEANTEEGAWERYERIRDGRNVVIVTQGQLDMEQSMSLAQRNQRRRLQFTTNYTGYKDDWWNLISEQYKKESQKAMELAYQRGIADYQDTMEVQRRSIKAELAGMFGTLQQEMKDIDDDSDSDTDEKNDQDQKNISARNDDDDDSSSSSSDASSSSSSDDEKSSSSSSSSSDDEFRRFSLGQQSLAKSIQEIRNSISSAKSKKDEITDDSSDDDSDDDDSSDDDIGPHPAPHHIEDYDDDDSDAQTGPILPPEATVDDDDDDDDEDEDEDEDDGDVVGPLPWTPNSLMLQSSPATLSFKTTVNVSSYMEAFDYIISNIPGVANISDESFSESGTCRYDEVDDVVSTITTTTMTIESTNVVSEYSKFAAMYGLSRNAALTYEPTDQMSEKELDGRNDEIISKQSSINIDDKAYNGEVDSAPVNHVSDEIHYTETITTLDTSMTKAAIAVEKISTKKIVTKRYASSSDDDSSDDDGESYEDLLARMHLTSTSSNQATTITAVTTTIHDTKAVVVDETKSSIKEATVVVEKVSTQTITKNSYVSSSNDSDSTDDDDNRELYDDLLARMRLASTDSSHDPPPTSTTVEATNVINGSNSIRKEATIAIEEVSKQEISKKGNVSASDDSDSSDDDDGPSYDDLLTRLRLASTEPYEAAAATTIVDNMVANEVKSMTKEVPVAVEKVATEKKISKRCTVSSSDDDSDSSDDDGESYDDLLARMRLTSTAPSSEVVIIATASDETNSNIQEPLGEVEKVATEIISKTSYGSSSEDNDSPDDGAELYDELLARMRLATTESYEATITTSDDTNNTIDVNEARTDIEEAPLVVEKVPVEKISKTSTVSSSDNSDSSVNDGECYDDLLARMRTASTELFEVNTIATAVDTNTIVVKETYSVIQEALGEVEKVATEIISKTSSGSSSSEDNDSPDDGAELYDELLARMRLATTESYEVTTITTTVDTNDTIDTNETRTDMEEAPVVVEKITVEKISKTSTVSSSDDSDSSEDDGKSYDDLLARMRIASTESFEVNSIATKVETNTIVVKETYSVVIEEAAVSTEKVCKKSTVSSSDDTDSSDDDGESYDDLLARMRLAATESYEANSTMITTVDTNSIIENETHCDSFEASVVEATVSTEKRDDEGKSYDDLLARMRSASSEPYEVTTCTTTVDTTTIIIEETSSRTKLDTKIVTDQSSSSTDVSSSSDDDNDESYEDLLTRMRMATTIPFTASITTAMANVTPANDVAMNESNSSKDLVTKQVDDDMSSSSDDSSSDDDASEPYEDLLSRMRLASTVPYTPSITITNMNNLETTMKNVVASSTSSSSSEATVVKTNLSLATSVATTMCATVSVLSTNDHNNDETLQNGSNFEMLGINVDTEKTVEGEMKAKVEKTRVVKSCMKTENSTKTKRSVQFFDDVVSCYHYVELLKDIPAEIHDSVWWTSQEMLDLKHEYEGILFMIDTGKPLDPELESARGLEIRSEEGEWKFYEHKRDAWNAVLGTQEDNVNHPTLDELISIEYVNASAGKTREEAIQRAIEDYREIQEYLTT